MGFRGFLMIYKSFILAAALISTSVYAQNSNDLTNPITTAPNTAGSLYPSRNIRETIGNVKSTVSNLTSDAHASSETLNTVTGGCPMGQVKVRVHSASAKGTSYTGCRALSSMSCYYSRVGGGSPAAGVRCLSGASPLYQSSSSN